MAIVTRTKSRRVKDQLCATRSLKRTAAAHSPLNTTDDLIDAVLLVSKSKAVALHYRRALPATRRRLHYPSLNTTGVSNRARQEVL